jgi:hypothetical protein
VGALKGRECIPFATTSVHPRFFGGVSVAHLFSCLCCDFACLLVFILCLVCPMLPVSLDGLSILDCPVGFF